MFNEDDEGNDTGTDRFSPSSWVHREPKRRNSEFSFPN